MTEFLDKVGLRHLLSKFRAKEPKLILDWKYEPPEGDVITPIAYDYTTKQFEVANPLPDWVTEEGAIVCCYPLIEKIDYIKWNTPEIVYDDRVITRIDDTHFTYSGTCPTNNMAIGAFVFMKRAADVNELWKIESKRIKIVVDDQVGVGWYYDTFLRIEDNGSMYSQYGNIPWAHLDNTFGLERPGMQSYECILKFGLTGDDKDDIVEYMKAQIRLYSSTQTFFNKDVYYNYESRQHFTRTGWEIPNRPVYLALQGRFIGPRTRVRIYEMPEEE